MNASQTAAIAYAETFLRRELDKAPERQDTLTTRIQTTDYGRVWLIAETEMKGLPDGNLLKALSRQHWMISVGKRGALEVWQMPRHFEQFKGGRAFGMAFRKN